MKTAKKPPAKKRAILVSSLAAKLLGHTRVTTAEHFSAQQMALVFPGFHAMELAHAINELIDKDLFKQKGHEERATYSLTDLGREGRVAVD